MAAVIILVFIGVVVALDVLSVKVLVLIPHLVARVLVTLHTVGNVCDSIVVIHNSDVTLRKLAKYVIAEFGISDSGLSESVERHFQSWEMLSHVKGCKGG